MREFTEGSTQGGDTWGRGGREEKEEKKKKREEDKGRNQIASFEKPSPHKGLNSTQPNLTQSKEH